MTRPDYEWVVEPECALGFSEAQMREHLGVPLYLLIGPERGLVAGPGMADCPCHQ